MLVKCLVYMIFVKKMQTRSFIFQHGYDKLHVRFDSLSLCLNQKSVELIFEGTYKMSVTGELFTLLRTTLASTFMSLVVLQHVCRNAK